MIKKRGRSVVADKEAFLSPSSALLDHHFDELLETIEEIRGLTAILKSLPPANEKREEYEGWLYAALTHLDHHVKPRLRVGPRGGSDAR